MGYSYYFKEFEVNFEVQKRLNYRDFLINEFFNLSKNDKSEFLEWYYQKYGSSARDYLMTNYWYSWEHGSRLISNVQSDRICAIMTILLNEEAKIKLGANDFVMAIKETISNFIRDQDYRYQKNLHLRDAIDILKYFENELRLISEITTARFNFGILKDDEKKEAIEIAKYILETKIYSLYTHVSNDFKIFSQFLADFKYGKANINYKLKTFNLIIDIHKISNNNFEFPIYKVKEIDSTFRFKIYADKFMAYELVSIYKEVNKSIEEALLNESDLTLFLNQYNLLINGENEVLINSTFQGQGGKLTIRIGIIPPNLLKKIILKSILKIILYLSIIFTSVLLVFKVNFLLIFAIWGVLF